MVKETHPPDIEANRKIHRSFVMLSIFAVQIIELTSQSTML